MERDAQSNLATQNPIDFYGTYPLPEGQRDRFMISVGLGYPTLEPEKEIAADQTLRHPIEVIYSTVNWASYIEGVLHAKGLLPWSEMPSPSENEVIYSTVNWASYIEGVLHAKGLLPWSEMPSPSENEVIYSTVNWASYIEGVLHAKGLLPWSEMPSPSENEVILLAVF